MKKWHSLCPKVKHTESYHLEKGQHPEKDHLERGRPVKEIPGVRVVLTRQIVICPSKPVVVAARKGKVGKAAKAGKAAKVPVVAAAAVAVVARKAKAAKVLVAVVPKGAKRQRLTRMVALTWTRIRPYHLRYNGNHSISLEMFWPTFLFRFASLIHVLGYTKAFASIVPSWKQCLQRSRSTADVVTKRTNLVKSPTFAIQDEMLQCRNAQVQVQACRHSLL
jgi:hypothetical protein